MRLPRTFLCLVAVCAAANSASPRLLSPGFHFEPEMARPGAPVRYRASSGGAVVYVTPSNVTFALADGASIRMSVAGSSGGVIEPEEKLPGTVNYLTGNDPSRWRTRVPRYGRLRHRNVARGVDLIYHGNGRNLEYDLVLAPGADPRALELVYDGGALRVDGGDLVISCLGGEIRQRKPLVYQEVRGKRVEVEAAYRIRGSRAGFELARYDRSKPVVIDPIVTFSTRLGGERQESVARMTPGAGGSVYLIGSSQQGSDLSINDGDALVAKFDNAGTLVYSTYLGGSNLDLGQALAVDPSGAVYVAGATRSPDFPAIRPFRGTLTPPLTFDPHGPPTDLFLAKISPAGDRLEFSTYFGGSGWDHAAGIAVDSQGGIHVAGTTDSPDLPATGAVQSRLVGGRDGFLAKFNAAASDLIYATYFGGTNDDDIRAMAIDPRGAVYVFGDTASPDLPLANALQARLNLGSASRWTDLFAAKFAPSTSGSLAPVYSTYLGGSGYEYAFGLHVDSAGSAYLSAYSASPDFPLVNPYKAAPPMGSAAAMKLAPDGATLVFSTFLADYAGVTADAIVADPSGSVYVAGSARFGVPLIDPPRGTAPFPAGGFDAFVMRMASAGNTATMSAIAGGAGNDRATALAMGASGAIWIGGSTDSDSQTTDAFLLKIEPEGEAMPVSVIPSPVETFYSSSAAISWPAVNGASGYSVRIYKDPELPGAPETFFTGNFSGNTTSAQVELPEGDFVVAVRPCFSGRFADCGGESLRKVRVRLPVPHGSVEVRSPNWYERGSFPQTFSWTLVPGATSYRLQIDKSGGGTTLDVRVPATELPLTVPLPGGLYFMSVEACSTACAGAGPWRFRVYSSAEEFPRASISSAVAGGDGKLTVTWSSIARADSYHVRVVQPPPAGPSGGPLTVASARTPATHVTLAVPPGEASVVVAACEAMVCGPDSDPVKIAPTAPAGAAPVVSQPADGSWVEGPPAEVAATPILIAWSRVGGDDGANTTYRLIVRDAYRRSTAVDQRTTANYQSVYLFPGTRYEVEVIANPGPSEVRGPISSFYASGRPPVRSTPVAPANGSQVKAGNVTIGWTRAGSQSLYRYRVMRAGSAEPVASGVAWGTEVNVPLAAIGGAETEYQTFIRTCRGGNICRTDSEEGWNPWPDASRGDAVGTFTVVP